MLFNYADILATAIYCSILAGLAIFGLHRYFILYLYWKHKRTRFEARENFAELPRVTVQLPIFNEIHVLERLVRSVAALKYPKDKLEIQILDDSTDETRDMAADLASDFRARGFDMVHIHRTDRTGFKAGALEHGLQFCKGEFILILDADFMPPADLLEKTIPFFTDGQVGMIQTRWGHINRKYSFLTRVQAMFLDGHLLLEQTARSRSGRFFNFNGTAGLWRKTCIEDAGGWQHDTLTEDLDLSYRAQLKGWRFVFLPEVVTPAELPVEMNGFKAQQHRWTKGSIQTFKKLLPRIWRSPLPLAIKVEATFHLTSNFVYLFVAVLCVFLLLGGNKSGAGGSALLQSMLHVPVFLAASLSAIIYYICAQRELYRNSWKKDLCLLPLLLAVGIGLSLNNTRAVLEALFNHQSGFTRTPKYGIHSRRQTWRTGKYLPIRSVVTVIELVFAVAFTWFLGAAFLKGAFFSLPFLALFAVGFSFVGLSSLHLRLPRFFDRDDRPAESSDGALAT